MSLPEISGVDETGYLRPELQIKVKPNLLEKYEISLNQIKKQVLAQNVRRPLGSMKDSSESEVSIVSELNDIKSIEEVTVSSGFQGQTLKLSQLAKIENGFENTNSITKVQGREGILLNIKKNSNADILTAQEAVVKFIKKFKNNIQGSQVDFVLIDDESYDVKNRLNIIGLNGLIGFTLILLVLFLFLNFKTGIWVAMGIPFTMAFTLITSQFFDFTINNITLAAVIIVLGIVVDDAIIVAENISRRQRKNDNDSVTAAVLEVNKPVIASVLTTCAAFVPLYFLSSHFGMFVRSIPTIISLMLLASLIESFFILPSHMASNLKIEGFIKKHFPNGGLTKFRQKMTTRVEEFYSKFLGRALRFRHWIILSFILFLSVSGYLFYKDMKYVMFPREESRSFRVSVRAPEGTTKSQMAKMVRTVENVFLNDKREIVTSVRTDIGQNRRGGKVKENYASLRVEIVPPSEREISLNQLLKGWESKTQALKEFKSIKYQRSWFGSSSGSPLVIEIQENNDVNREAVVKKLVDNLKKMKELTNVEVSKPLTKQEFRLEIDKNNANRLGINYEQLTATLRAYIEGDILYTLNSGEEEVDVRFTSDDASKDNINKLLNLTVSNKDNYLVPIRNLVTVVKRDKPANIQRVNYKRAVTVYADMSEGATKTVLEVAEFLEKNTFPKILFGVPTTNLRFSGEVEDSRESQSDFSLSIWLTLGIIYILLIFLFNSLWTPLLIGAIIPFGIAGTALSFWAHGMTQYGFFAVIGTLGMIGVVINDSIVLISKLESKMLEPKILEIRKTPDKLMGKLIEIIANTSATRLRAIIITTVTTVAGLFPTTYGIGGYDSMLAEMMLAMSWGLIFGMFITLLLVPCLYSFYAQIKYRRLEETK